VQIESVYTPSTSTNRLNRNDLAGRIELNAHHCKLLHVEISAACASRRESREIEFGHGFQFSAHLGAD
jgi:hypothetical protein